MVPPSSGRISRVPPYSSPHVPFTIATGLSPAVGGLSIPLRSPYAIRNPAGLVPVRSPLLRESRLISFPPGTEMFQFPGFASSGLCVRPVDTLARGFPHSESPWSKTLCVSHGTFGAWPVLRRRQMPRHPPRAFFRIIFFSSGSALVLLHEQLESTFFGASSHSSLDCLYLFTAVISICRKPSRGCVCARGRYWS